MLGVTEELEVPSPNRGMIPRIFEFLFARIKAVKMLKIVLMLFNMYGSLDKVVLIF